MFSEYGLQPRQARVCRVIAWFFGLTAAIAILTPVIMLAATGDPLAQWSCSTQGDCGFTNGALTPLDETVREAIAASPAATERYADHLARPAIRVGLSLLSILSSVPFAALMLGVAMALRSFGTSQGIGGALNWLRLASFAALIAAIAPPIIDLLRSAILLPGTPHGPGYSLEIDGGPILLHMLLAIASLAIVWALDAGHRAQRDLSEFV